MTRRDSSALLSPALYANIWSPILIYYLLQWRYERQTANRAF